MSKNKKRLLALVLAGGILAVSGCGGVENAPKVPEIGEAETEQEKVLSLTFSTVEADDYDPETGRWLLHTEYQKLETSGEGRAADALRQWSEDRAEELEGLRKQRAADAALGEVSEENEVYYQYSIYQSLKTARVDSQVISLIEGNSEYTGGAHGNYGSTGVNFDAVTGTLLELSDLLTDEEGFWKKAEEELIRELSKTYGDGLFPDYEDTIHKLRTGSPNWYLNGAGIAFVFQPYLVGPYAMGEPVITIPYEKLEGHLSEAYLPKRMKGPEGAGVYQIPEGETVSWFLSVLDSQARTLKVGLAKGEEGYASPVRVEAGDDCLETGAFERMGEAVLLSREDGSVFLLFDADYASDDFVTFVYELTDGNLKECDRIEGLSMQGAVVNTDQLELLMHLEVLGSYRSPMVYTIGPDGKLLQDETWFSIPPKKDPWSLLVTVRELPVRIEGEAVTLPVGSRIRITATDNKGTVRFLDEDTKAEGEIDFVRGDTAEDSWSIFIDGIRDTEYFEMVPYAG